MFIDVFLDDERWRRISDVLDFIRDEYYVSDYGRIYNDKTKKFMTPSKAGRYPSVGIYTKYGDRRTYTVHRLVSYAFVSGHTDDNSQVNHIDGWHENNYYKNLEWCTAKYNIRHAFNIGLREHQFGENHHKNIYSKETIHKICKMIELGLKPDKIIEEVFGLCIIQEDKKKLQRLIKHIKRKEHWVEISSQYNF